MTQQPAYRAPQGNPSAPTARGVVVVPKSEKSEDELLEIVLEAGAEEVNDNGDTD